MRQFFDLAKLFFARSIKLLSCYSSSSSWGKGVSFEHMGGPIEKDFMQAYLYSHTGSLLMVV